MGEQLLPDIEAIGQDAHAGKESAIQDPGKEILLVGEVLEYDGGNDDREDNGRKGGPVDRQDAGIEEYGQGEEEEARQVFITELFGVQYFFKKEYGKDRPDEDAYRTLTEKEEKVGYQHRGNRIGIEDRNVMVVDKKDEWEQQHEGNAQDGVLIEVNPQQEGEDQVELFFHGKRPEVAGIPVAVDVEVFDIEAADEEIFKRHSQVKAIIENKYHEEVEPGYGDDAEEAPDKELPEGYSAVF